MLVFQMSEAVGGCQRLPETVRGHQYVGLKILQEGSHFSASQVPHMRHLRHIPVMCLILRHLLKSTNDYKIKIQNNFI